LDHAASPGAQLRETQLPYQNRADGRIAVTIDSNVWNLFERLDLRLAIELPAKRFILFIPRQIEIEIAAIPDRPEKAGIRAYIAREMTDSAIGVTAVFGFARQGSGPERHGGFGFGTFQSEDARAFYAAISETYLLNRRTKGSGLTDNEGDAAVAAASLSSVVLTLDIKPGPLRAALDHGGKVLDMTPFESSGLSLEDYIAAYHGTA
jgi:uncharacterized ubiquitin-like protein YukD